MDEFTSVAGWAFGRKGVKFTEFGQFSKIKKEREQEETIAFEEEFHYGYKPVWPQKWKVRLAIVLSRDPVLLFSELTNLSC